MLVPGSAQAESSTEEISYSTSEIAERYRPGSIGDVTVADTAIRDIQQQRSLIEAHYLKQERACLPTFFTNHCLDNAKEQRREAKAMLRPVEIEANAFKRRARVDERDHALAKKLEKSPLEPKAESLENNHDDQTSLIAPATANAPTTSSSSGRRHAAAAKPVKARTPRSSTENIAAEQRNMAAYDKKLAASLQRQEAVAARKAKAEAERQNPAK